MRTTEQLRLIAAMAKALQTNRGDTEWSDDERARVTTAYEALGELSISPPNEVRRFTERKG